MQECKEEKKMKQMKEMDRKQLTDKELEEVYAGIGPFFPPLPGLPRRRRVPDINPDKPRDGGATGGW